PVGAARARRGRGGGRRQGGAARRRGLRRQRVERVAGGLVGRRGLVGRGRAEVVGGLLVVLGRRVAVGGRGRAVVDRRRGRHHCRRHHPGHALGRVGRHGIDGRRVAHRLR